MEQTSILHIEEQCTIFTIKSIKDGYVWKFYYDLNGDYMLFKVSSKLTDVQKKWLNKRYPWRIEDIREWQKNLKANFQIIVNMPELDFESFWKMYPAIKSSNKRTAKERFDKLKPDEKEKLFIETPSYIKYKKQENQFFPYCEVYIRGRWWDK